MPLMIGIARERFEFLDNIRYNGNARFARHALAGSSYRQWHVSPRVLTVAMSTPWMIHKYTG
jgi:hypothetical protein